MSDTKQVQKGYKYRIYPTPTQATHLRQQFGCKRFVYNHFLALWQKSYHETQTGLSYQKCANQLPLLKQELSWLKLAHSQVLQQGLKDLEQAFHRFFKKQASYPRFKQKRGRQTIRYPQGFKVAEEKEGCYLPKIGWVKTVFHRPLVGQLKSVTVSMNPAGQFFVSFLSEEEMAEPEFNGGEIGVDMGLTHFLTTSEGEKIPNPRHLFKSLKRLKHQQRAVSRQQKGSKNREKSRLKLAKLHQKVVNQRQDFLHKLTTRLVNENQVIGLENLNVQGLMQNHCLAQSIGVVGWSEFKRQLQYKGTWYGCQIREVSRFYPSSKTCSVCHYQHQALKLSERQWVCPVCQSHHDRDLNAALNLKFQATAGTAGS